MKNHVFNVTYKKSKYHSRRVTNRSAGGFDSELEENCFLFLKALQHAGKIKYFLRQVPFHLIGGITYRVDFLLFCNNDKALYLDVKGVITPLFITKKKIVEESYPVNIEVLYKSDYKTKIMKMIEYCDD